jgi:hypothetical protein
MVKMAKRKPTLITQNRENDNKSLIYFKAMDYVCVGGGKVF